MPHGVANALLLPHVLRAHMAHFPTRYLGLAPAFGVDPTGAPAAVCAAMLQALTHLLEQFPLPRRLAEVGVGKEELPLLAEEAVCIRRLLENDPQPLTLAAIRTIYEEAW